MNKIEEYKAVERLYVPHWLTDRIQVANFDLVDHMKWLLVQDPRWQGPFTVSLKDIEHLDVNHQSLRNLLRTPFLMVAPTLPSIEDWRCFIDNTASTVHVHRLRESLPPSDGLAVYSIQHQNRTFVDLVMGVIHMSVLSAPLLGITIELARYLASVPAWKLRLALDRMGGLPLFRWRFNSMTFWLEFAGAGLTDESVAHHIMLTSPIKAGDLPPGEGWGQLRLDRARNERYAAALMAHGCRASIASALFRLNQNAMRQQYFEIHGRSSNCGNRASSLQWFVDSPRNRLHATVYSWLYRSATAMGANAPEALIATNDIYERLFGDRPPISADRGFTLTRAMHADSRLDIAPCRSCGTHYVMSNNEERIEMRQSFVCPACEQQLGPRRRAAKRKVN